MRQTEHRLLIWKSRRKIKKLLTRGVVKTTKESPVNGRGKKREWELLRRREGRWSHSK